MCAQAAHLRAGEKAEALVLKKLEKEGLRLLHKNFRCQLGEIDLVMMDQHCLVFVEVRYRKNDLYGGALSSITTTKQAKIRKTASYFLQQNPNLDYQDCRFDVVALTGKGGQTEIQWLENAFQ